jgi:hypothetical protein
MIMSNRAAALFAAAVLLLAVASAAPRPQSAPKPAAAGEMSDYQRDVEQYPEAALAAASAVPGSDTDSNPHMYMTVLQARNAEDDRRSEVILDIVRRSISRYRDYKAALLDGYQIFMPNKTQAEYRFPNYRYAFSAAFLFNPGHPTALLYRKTKDGGYELRGAMFTAPKNATREQLNERIPLSVARWYEHVNVCMPPKGTPAAQADRKQFGLTGSIASQDACAQAGGRWVPQIFGWTVHVYPFESDPDKVWSH